MSRGIGWLEEVLFDYLRLQRGGASFAALIGHTFEYNQWGSYQSRVGSVRRALRSLSGRGHIEERVYGGAIIYTIRRDQHPAETQIGSGMGSAESGQSRRFGDG